jgi:formylglycine-generating enzyme required for sulfatase activity
MKLGKMCLFSLAALMSSLALHSARANNLQIVHVRLTGDNGSSVIVEFDINWDNSWRNDLPGAGNAAPFNYDAAWVFVKYSTDGGATWRHATLSSADGDHGVTVTNGVPATIKAVSDGKGVFIHRAQNGAGSNNWDDVRLLWSYATDRVASLTKTTIVNVLAIEMVFIPPGGFQAGDRAASGAAFLQGSSDPDPWEITSEDAISVTNTVSDGFYYVSGGNTEDPIKEDPTGSTFTIPAAFPKGFNAFYMMKHEITQGQYADFFNMISSIQASNRNLTAEPGYTSFRGTISGSHPYFSAAAKDRACNFLSIMDGAAYADWAALRPVTELEFEKACRGNQPSAAGEFAWGNTNITQATTLSGAEDGTETFTNPNANCVFDDATFSGGNGGKGPARGGIFAASANPLDTPGEQRQDAGASFYGVMELSGNLWERTVTVGNAQGRSFAGTHGDGHLTTRPGFEGNATNSDWPGFFGSASKGVISAGGSGYRGGGWLDDSNAQRVSERSNAARYEKRRLKDFGFRCARTAP